MNIRRILFRILFGPVVAVAGPPAAVETATLRLPGEEEHQIELKLALHHIGYVRTRHLHLWGVNWTAAAPIPLGTPPTGSITTGPHIALTGPIAKTDPAPPDWIDRALQGLASYIAHERHGNGWAAHDTSPPAEPQSPHA